MKKNRVLLTLALLGVIAFRCPAGTVSYQAIPATASDANCGITQTIQYTTSVDGGNASGTDRVINGITLSSLAAKGGVSTTNNCTLRALSGNLANGAGTGANIQADGTLKDVLLDMTLNNGAGDNSQQEIVLDPASLQPGVTYDLRVYIGNSGSQNRQVNLAFAGDAQDPVETGWFNEDDARTSAGGFNDANQAYFINYRFTWDGDTVPGITIAQKSGEAPFCLYALTNQVVPVEETAAASGEEAGNVGLANAGSDQVGVASDDFYTSDSLNANGRWVNVERWGRCWQPTSVASGWRPYTNGNWRECSDCGWTFVSDEPWAWACYHYGRWCKVRSGCGWAWVPGKVWAASWVSWRRGRDESCSCIGWAPLPPQASCELNVGITASVDQRWDIGPDYYTFVNIRDFGSDSYAGCGCIYEHSRNAAILGETINITNIYFDRHVIYCGGPDLKWCNERIRKFGGKEIAKITVRRFSDPEKMGVGKFSRLEGNQLALFSPRVRGDKSPRHIPKMAERISNSKIDKGWSVVKDRKQEKQLRNHIAAEDAVRNPEKATLPVEVAERIGNHRSGTRKDGTNKARIGTEEGVWHPGESMKHKKIPAGGQPTTQSDTSPP